MVDRSQPKSTRGGSTTWFTNTVRIGARRRLDYIHRGISGEHTKDGTTVELLFGLFGWLIEVNRSQREAVLVYSGDEEVMMYLPSFAKELLLELCSKIEEVNANMKNPQLQICPILPNGYHIYPPTSPLHNLYKVKLKNAEIWAIDTTGAQHGYGDPLCPWRDFEQHRPSKINRESEFGYIHQVFQSYGMLPARTHGSPKGGGRKTLPKPLAWKFLHRLRNMVAN